ncbi:MAG: CDP-alcohol phosphatidyltransferase family protein [Chromatiales bacterium]|nr:MAG: CDP-alcohol phosphatidyltransferase family protein [Chromatiales bacterium]
MSLGLHHLPNAICIVRIVLIVPIVMLMLAGDYQLALGLVMVAGASDALDGWLAKHFGWQTRIGGLLDPAADKLLLVSLFLTLTWLGLTPLWLTIVVLGRDLVIVSGAVAFNFLIRKVQPEPSNISKLNSFLQLTYGVSVLAAEAFGWPPAMLILITGAAVLVTSVVSGLDYVLTWGHRARVA